MMNAVNVRIDALQTACIGFMDYMEKANERFQKIIAQEPDMELRWDEFYRSRKQGKEVTLPELREMVSKMEENQIIEAGVRIR